MRPNCCLLLSAAGLMLSWGGAASATCPALPYTIANGQVSDATHLMADLNALAACPNSGSAGATNAGRLVHRRPDKSWRKWPSPVAWASRPC